MATYPVHGVVISSITHEPIARALVEESHDATLTDINGRFELNLPAGPAQLNVRRPGFNSSVPRGVEVSENTPELTLSITPQAVISGHISLSTGEDAEGIRVLAYRQVVSRGRRSWQPQGNTETDSEGRFRFTGLIAPAADLLVTMPKSDGPAGTRRRSFGYASVYYPGGAEAPAASLLLLAPGQHATAELSINRQPFYPVSIQLKNYAERNDIFVEVHEDGGLVADFPVQWNVQRHSGDVDLPAGRYYAELHANNGVLLYGRVDFTVTGGPLTLSVSMLPLKPVLVEVHKDFQSPGDNVAAGLPLLAGRQRAYDPGLNLFFSSAAGMSDIGGSLEPVPGSADPLLFQLQGLTPGSYWVQATPFMGYVSSLSSGGVDLTREPLTIGPGNTTPPIIVTLRDDGGQVQGGVRKSSDANATLPITTVVYAVPLFNTPSPIPQAGMQAGGDFTIGNVAPGNYRVIALDEPQEVDTLGSAVLQAYLAKGQTVTVEAKGTASVTLDLIHVSDPGGDGGGQE